MRIRLMAKMDLPAQIVNTVVSYNSLQPELTSYLHVARRILKMQNTVLLLSLAAASPDTENFGMFAGDSKDILGTAG